MLLNDKTFYKISTTATGKAIVYAQRNVQLKKKGNYKVVTKEGEARFSLNKNFYVDGSWYSGNNKNQHYIARYIDGTKIYSEEDFGNGKSLESTAVKKEGKDYWITKTKVYNQDSVIEKYKNQKPLLKEKYRNRKLILQNDRVKNTVVIYDNYGNLEERHYDNIEEKYRSNGAVYFKKISFKDRVEEYNNGLLNKVYEFKTDKIKGNITLVTNYDDKGKITDTREEYATAEVAPEYRIFDLGQQEFATCKTIPKN